MKAANSAFMHSRFFNPAFNSAIFDGPLRIYFAQFHESLALKIYFQFQSRFKDELQRAKEIHRETGQNILVMLYPSKDAFEMSFDSGAEFMKTDELEGDDVVGLAGPFEDNQLDSVTNQVCQLMKKWKHVPAMHASL